MTRPRRFVVALAMIALSGCATPHSAQRAAQSTPVLMPSRPDATTFSAASVPKHIAENTEGGLTIVRLDGKKATFSAALLFEGGALDDPIGLPGLTAWLPEAALIEVGGNPAETLVPHQRAFKYGGVILPIADGQRIGWAVVGPLGQAEELLALLSDVALAATYPAAEVQLLARQARQRLEAEQDGQIRDTINVAAGMALGLNRPIAVQATARLYDSVNREHLVRHHRAMVRPEFATLVLSSGRVDVPKRLRVWKAAEVQAQPPRTCRPHGRQVHAIIDPDRDPERSLMLLASALPQAEGQEQIGLAALLKLLKSRRGTLLEPGIGRDQAERATPTLVSIGGRGLAARDILMFGTLGFPDDAQRDLKRVGKFLSEGLSETLDEEMASHAFRLLDGERRQRLMQPISALLESATEASHPSPKSPPDIESLRALARTVFAPWRYTMAVLGSQELYDLLLSDGPVIRWASDRPRLIDVDATPRCEPDSLPEGL